MNVHFMVKQITTQERLPAATARAHKQPAKEALAHAQTDIYFEGNVGRHCGTVRYLTKITPSRSRLPLASAVIVWESVKPKPY